MRLPIALPAAALFCFAIATPVAGTLPIPVRVVCPLNGQAIETYDNAAYSSWGERPDGKPYGSAEFPTPLVECADGLVMYERVFPLEAVERLRPLVGSEDYARLRTEGHSTYYRAYWLARRMGESPRNQLAMLIQAIWQTDDSSILRRLYLEELVERAAEAGAADDLVGLALRARTINALRELGRFDEAAAMLRSSSFDAAAATSDAREVRAWRRFHRQLALLVARRDRSIEPLDMIPRREARRIRRGEPRDD